MFVEYALRFSASAISSVAATSAFRITSNVIGSTPPPVHLPRALEAHLALAHVARDELAVALLRRPVAAAAARAEADRVAGLHVDRRLRAEPRLRAAADEHVLRGLARQAAERARRPGHRAVGEDGERRRAVEDEVLAQAEAAAVAPGAVGVVDEREPGDAHRVVQLGLLDRRVLGVLAVRLHRVRPVAAVAPAVAAGERLEEAVVLVRLVDRRRRSRRGTSSPSSPRAAAGGAPAGAHGR